MRSRRRTFGLSWWIALSAEANLKARICDGGSSVDWVVNWG